MRDLFHRRCRIWLVWLLPVCGALAGCVQSTSFRLTPASEEEKLEKELAVGTIGDATEVANMLPIQISGVGLVSGLRGTGGGNPPGEYRKMLEREMRLRKVPDIKAKLASPDYALVLLNAWIPPGVRKGDRIDVEVTLPNGSKVESLRGGYLERAALWEYKTTKQLAPESRRPNGLLKGYVFAKAEGPLLVGFGNPDDPAELRRGRIWSGAVSLIDRPLHLVLKKDVQFARVANAVAQRINTMYYDDAQKRARLLKHKDLFVLNNVAKGINKKFGQGFGNDMAMAQKKDTVAIQVPYAYRFNKARYLRVARLIPLQSLGERRGGYQQKLQEMLVDPKYTVRAALRLEALGERSVNILKSGLESPEPLVRFCSAEAMTYLGSASGVEELALLAVNDATYRAYCLMALASLDEAICRNALADLMASPDVELRCGAFRALRLLDDADRHLHGERVGGFWLHRVAPGTESLIHFGVDKRAEIVLFGESAKLLTPAKILAGPDFTVTADRDDSRCTVTRYLKSEGRVIRQQCSLHVEHILRTITHLGGGYTDAVEFLRKADSRDRLSCPINVNGLPEIIPVELLAQQGMERAKELSEASK